MYGDSHRIITRPNNGWEYGKLWDCQLLRRGRMTFLHARRSGQPICKLQSRMTHPQTTQDRMSYLHTTRGGWQASCQRIPGASMLPRRKSLLVASHTSGWVGALEMEYNRIPTLILLWVKAGYARRRITDMS